ncbi:ATP-dependent DNA ligase [Patescibacteria group bacterium]|nr:ATP-dependent DNA ligase [Patescibacteria group bacterium]
MKFSELSNYLEQLEKTSSRIEITKILAELFKKTDKGEIDKTVYLLLGSLGPSYEGIVFNLAERMMVRVIAKAYSRDAKKVKAIYKKKGDLGDVAASLATGRGKGLGVAEVYDRLFKVAKDEGEGSQDRKVKAMAKLLSELDPLSVRFVARIPIGKLRLGFSDKTVIDALSWMKKGDKSLRGKLETAYFVLPDVGLLAKKVKQLGVSKATKDTLPVVGVPVLPMLAQRLKSPAEMIKKMGQVGVEPKFDGLRIQIHYRKGPPRLAKASRGEAGFVKAFTRNMNETSWMFPELAKIGSFISASEVILDTEAVGLDEKTRALANFQTTMTRRRKHEIEETARKIAIKFYVFDILFKDGKNFMGKTYIERRKELAKTVKDSRVFQVVDYQLTKDASVIAKEMLREVKEGLEGIIIKRADSRYVPGRTGWRWVKMKEKEKAHAKLADTIDCVVMGYSAGRGRRAEFGVGQFLVGVREKDQIKTVTKVGTGLTDEQFRELKKRLKRIEVGKKPKEFVVHKNLEPDTWVTPSLVVEIAADEITKSPTHTAGFALRFPRLIKFRDDKSVNQATTLSEVKRLFKLQN